MSFYYKIYGLTIKSSRKINILPEIDISSADLDIIWAASVNYEGLSELPWIPIVTNELKIRKQISFFKADTQQGTFFKVFFNSEYGGFYFVIDPQKEKLWILYNQNEPENDLDSYFTGTLMGCVLRLKGIMCLHSSAVNINGEAILLVGQKRSGKSTTAAAFAKLGYKVLCDDIAAISVKNNILYVESGYSKVRLRPASAQALHSENLDVMPEVFSVRKSRYANVTETFQREALPLGAIYFLGGEPGYNAPPVIEPVANDVLYLLHANTFANYVITPDMRKDELKMLAIIASQASIKHLKYGHDVKIVNLQCEAVINDRALKLINS